MWQFAEVLPDLREISNRWSFRKDGKAYFDRIRYYELMRK
jgi:hypothetical protein